MFLILLINIINCICSVWICSFVFKTSYLKQQNLSEIQCLNFFIGGKSCFQIWWIYLYVDIVRVDALALQKNPKRHFFRDIQNSFHEVTHIGLEPHQFFSFWNISTNTVARAVQSFGRNGPWLAGWLSYGQNLLVKFAQTHDEQMLIISRRTLDSCLSYS